MEHNDLGTLKAHQVMTILSLGGRVWNAHNVLLCLTVAGI
jgi:hypothetical protein